MKRVLAICYGNPGRLDDGLGAAFAEKLAEASLPGVTLDVDYQLMVEHAATIAEHDAVVFIDAAVRGPEPYFFNKIEPRAALSFSSHTIDPEALLALASDLFGSEVSGYTMGIRGYDFDAFGERLSAGARRNLDAARADLLPALECGKLDQLADAHIAEKSQIAPVNWAPVR